MSSQQAVRKFNLSQKRDMDMTQGNIFGQIIRFSLPLLVGNLFQQLYNTVDTWVVGNYVSNEAFSAVGSVAPVVNMLIGAFLGLSSGASVVISQYYGAGREDKVQDTVHTAISMTLVLSVVFTLFGLFITPYAVAITDLHPNAVDEATTYLSIYFSGMVGLMFYNIGAGILRAIGDSQRPFYFLVVCALLNTVFDLVFVLVFKMGVEGVAIATIISQGISAILVLITLFKTNTCVKIKLSKIKFHFPILKKILKVGIPAALQMAITGFSNIFVQSYFNYFDLNSPAPDIMSGWTAYLKIDQLLFLPMQSISLAVTTFVGQNLGKNQVARAKQGVTKALIIAMSATAILIVPVMVFAPHIVSFLNDKEEVVNYGTLFLHYITPFYLLCCFNQIYASALRGAGNSRASMFIMVSSFVVFRQIYLFCMSRIYNELIPIAMSYPAGWLLCSILTALYYHKTTLEKTRLVEDSE